MDVLNKETMMYTMPQIRIRIKIKGQVQRWQYPRR